MSLKNLENEPIEIRDIIIQIFKKILVKGRKIRKKLVKFKKKKHRDFHCQIIHRKSWAEEVFKDMVKNNIFYQKFKKFDNLAIITAHNYKAKSLFEKSLDHIGITDYISLNHPEVKEWNHKYKLIWLLDYIKSSSCEEDLILFCDAADCILINDPKKIVELFYKINCKLLFMSTGMPYGYPTKRSKIWARNFNGTKYRHLNSGVFIGRKNFLIKFLEESICIIEEIQLRKHPIWKSLRNYYPEKNIQYYSEKPSQFNLKIADQNIFRYLHPKYPQIKIDTNNEFACRNKMDLLMYLKYFLYNFIFTE